MYRLPSSATLLRTLAIFSTCFLFVLAPAFSCREAILAISADTAEPTPLCSYHIALYVIQDEHGPSTSLDTTHDLEERLAGLGITAETSDKDLDSTAHDLKSKKGVFDVVAVTEEVEGDRMEAVLRIVSVGHHHDNIVLEPTSDHHVEPCHIVPGANGKRRCRGVLLEDISDIVKAHNAEQHAARRR